MADHFQCEYDPGFKASSARSRVCVCVRDDVLLNTARIARHGNYAFEFCPLHIDHAWKSLEVALTVFMLLGRVQLAKFKGTITNMGNAGYLFWVKRHRQFLVTYLTCMHEKSLSEKQHKRR